MYFSILYSEEWSYYVLKYSFLIIVFLSSFIDYFSFGGRYYFIEFYIELETGLERVKK